jgi:hypothetical protein
MKKSAIYFLKLSTWDKISLLLYIVFTIYVSIVGLYQIESQKTVLVMYSVFTPFFLFTLNCRSLRNFSVFLVWVGIAVYHIWLSFKIRDFTVILSNDRKLVEGVSYTWVFLLLYFVLRVIHLKLRGIEFMPLEKSYYGKLDNRKLHVLDYLIFIVFFLFWVKFSMIGF